MKKTNVKRHVRRTKKKIVPVKNHKRFIKPKNYGASKTSKLIDGAILRKTYQGGDEPYEYNYIIGDKFKINSFINELEEYIKQDKQQEDMSLADWSITYSKHGKTPFDTSIKQEIDKEKKMRELEAFTINEESQFRRKLKNLFRQKGNLTNEDVKATESIFLNNFMLKKEELGISGEDDYDEDDYDEDDYED